MAGTSPAMTAHSEAFAVRAAFVLVRAGGLRGAAFFADFAAHERRITGDVMPEFGEELYASALWRP